MSTHHFTREQQGWFIEFPHHLRERCHQVKQAMAKDAGRILDKIAGGDTELLVSMDTEPFSGADVLELERICHEPYGGGYYSLISSDGRIIKRRMWLCDIPLFIFGDLPERIYLKRISSN